MESTGLQHLIDEYDFEKPKRGQLLEGEILLVDEKTIYLDVGTKRDAIVPIDDLEAVDETRTEHLVEGEQVPVVVTQPHSRQGELLVSIRKGLEQEDWDRAATILETGELVELEVVGQNRGGLEVDFGLLRGFVPNSHLIDIRRYSRNEVRQEMKAEKLGTKMQLKVIEVDRQHNRLILSARKARSQRKARRLREIEIGETIEGYVVNLVPFGAFVDLGGIDGLIHVSEIAWERVNRPADFLAVGDPVKVVVKDIDYERGRVGLSRKPFVPNPWDTIDERYEIGAVISGSITNVRDFGAFVRLESGIEGLVHVSEMGIQPGESPDSTFKKGDKVRAKIIEIDPYRNRIGLSFQKLSPVNQFGRESDLNQAAFERDEFSAASIGAALETKERGHESREEG